MKTNVPIELNDSQRDILANLIDGKATKRLASRADVVALCRMFLETLVEDVEESPEVNDVDFNNDVIRSAGQVAGVDLSVAAPEDRARLAGKDPGYIRGWNKVKHKMASRG